MKRLALSKDTLPRPITSLQVHIWIALITHSQLFPSRVCSFFSFLSVVSKEAKFISNVQWSLKSEALEVLYSPSQAPNQHFLIHRQGPSITLSLPYIPRLPRQRTPRNQFSQETPQGKGKGWSGGDSQKRNKSPEIFTCPCPLTGQNGRRPRLGHAA